MEPIVRRSAEEGLSSYRHSSRPEPTLPATGAIHIVLRLSEVDSVW